MVVERYSGCRKTQWLQKDTMDVERHDGCCRNPWDVYDQRTVQWRRKEQWLLPLPVRHPESEKDTVVVAPTRGLSRDRERHSDCCRGLSRDRDRHSDCCRVLSRDRDRHSDCCCYPWDIKREKKAH